MHCVEIFKNSGISKMIFYIGVKSLNILFICVLVLNISISFIIFQISNCELTQRVRIHYFFALWYWNKLWWVFRSVILNWRKEFKCIISLRSGTEINFDGCFRVHLPEDGLLTGGFCPWDPQGLPLTLLGRSLLSAKPLIFCSRPSLPNPPTPIPLPLCYASIHFIH